MDKFYKTLHLHFHSILHHGNAKLCLGCIQLSFIKAAPQQTSSTSYNRNRPEMTLNSRQSLLLIPASRWQHITMLLMNPTALWVPTTKCFHFTGSRPLCFKIKYTNAPVLWNNIDHCFCQTFSHFFLSHYWLRLAHSVNVLSCQTHSKWSQQKSLVQHLSFKDKSCIVCTGLDRRCVTISL